MSVLIFNYFKTLFNFNISSLCVTLIDERFTVGYCTIKQNRYVVEPLPREDQTTILDAFVIISERKSGVSRQRITQMCVICVVIEKPRNQGEREGRGEKRDTTIVGLREKLIC